MRKTKTYQCLPYNPALRDRAKALRKAGILHEALLWMELKSDKLNGLDFDRQKVIGNYIVDFYCAEKAVVIEVDGSSHDSKQLEDAQRDEWLRSLGLRVIRVLAKDVLQNLNGVVEFLKNHPALTDTPPREGNIPAQNSENALAPNSPPLEGWQAKPDGVVDEGNNPLPTLNAYTELKP
jgi:very-short-patch-repair endonuclease